MRQRLYAGDKERFTRTCCGCAKQVVVSPDEDYVVQFFCDDCAIKKHPNTRMRFCEECNGPMLVKSYDAIRAICPRGHIMQEIR